jgi:hypothetical protein
MEEAAVAIDRDEQFVTLFMVPGLCEQLHFRLGMEEATIALALEPELCVEFFNYFVDWEIEYAKRCIDRTGADALFHHDD